VAKRTGLLLSFDEAVGSNETSSYSDVNGVQNVTFNDIRKYSAMLMAFPLLRPSSPISASGGASSTSSTQLRRVLGRSRATP
jgi:hypothetical protein